MNTLEDIATGISILTFVGVIIKGYTNIKVSIAKLQSEVELITKLLTEHLNN